MPSWGETMNRCPRILAGLIPVLALACGKDDPKHSEHETGDDTAGCVDTTEVLPADSSISALSAMKDGRLWALGNAESWWKNEGEGWSAVPELAGTGGYMLATEGELLWVASHSAVFTTRGTSWTEVGVDLEGEENIEGLAGLGDGRVAIVSEEDMNPECEEDCPTQNRIVLRVGDADGFETTDLGTIEKSVWAVGSDGEGHALAAGYDDAWYYDGESWSELSLPVEGYWTDILGFGGEWVLLSEDGLVLRGAPDAWSQENLEVSVPRLSGDSLSNLWIVGTDVAPWGTFIYHDGGEGWVLVAGPDIQYAAVLARDGEVIIGGEGPAIARGDASGVAVEWTTPQITGGGDAWSMPDGAVFLAQYNGGLAVDREGIWTTLATDDESDTRFVSANGCDGIAYALSESASLVAWNGEEIERDDGLYGEGTFAWDLGMTADCVPVVSSESFEEGENANVRLDARIDGLWVSLEAPPGGFAYALLAPSLEDMLIATDEGLYAGDGATWTAISGVPSFVGDLARTEDGRVWVATQEDGLLELVDGALVAVEGSPERIDRLLAWGNAVFATAYDLGAHEASVHRWDGAWTELARPKDAGALLAIEGGDTLLVLEYDQLTRVCLDL